MRALRTGTGRLQNEPNFRSSLLLLMKYGRQDSAAAALRVHYNRPSKGICTKSFVYNRKRPEMVKARRARASVLALRIALPTRGERSPVFLPKWSWRIRSYSLRDRSSALSGCARLCASSGGRSPAPRIKPQKVAPHQRARFCVAPRDTSSVKPQEAASGQNVLHPTSDYVHRVRRIGIRQRLRRHE